MHHQFLCKDPCIEIDDASTFASAGSINSSTLSAKSILMDCGDKKFSGEDGSDLFSTSAWALEQGIVESKNTLNGYKNGANETSVATEVSFAPFL